MTQYINKDALVAEIERRIKTNKECMLGLRNLDYYQGKVDALNDTISFINTIEVKEVDLKKEIEVWEDSFKHCPASMEYKETAKHFFELGMQANNPLTWEDIANINDIVSEMLKECKDIILYDTQESFCKEVLKRFKALKEKKV